ncbi:hypothetical protein VULLAG_LOCUS15394 [Vulpes lagopus]
MPPTCRKGVCAAGRGRGGAGRGAGVVRGGAAPRARSAAAAWTRCRDAQGQRGELQGNFSQGKRPVVPARSLPAFCLFFCRRLESGRVPAAPPCAARPVRPSGAPGRPRTDRAAGPSGGRPPPRVPCGPRRPRRPGAALTAGAGPRLCPRRGQKTDL